MEKNLIAKKKKSPANAVIAFLRMFVISEAQKAAL